MALFSYNNLTPSFCPFFYEAHEKCAIMSYPEAVVTFAPDAFPDKFLRVDGSIVYDREDLRLYRIYPDPAAFRRRR